MVDAVLKLVPFVMKVLVGSGLIKDPQHEQEVRLKLLEVATQKEIAESTEFIEFLKATSPPAQYVWPFVNSLQALTRPALTWIVMGSIITSFFVDGVSARIAVTLEAFSRAGTAGLLFIAIPAWWFFGRSIERVIPGLSLLREAGGQGVAPPVVNPQPAAKPAVPQAAPVVPAAAPKPLLSPKPAAPPAQKLDYTERGSQL